MIKDHNTLLRSSCKCRIELLPIYYICYSFFFVSKLKCVKTNLENNYYTCVIKHYVVIKSQKTNLGTYIDKHV